MEGQTIVASESRFLCADTPRWFGAHQVPGAAGAAEGQREREEPFAHRIFQSGDRVFQWGPLILLDFIWRGCGNCHRANLGEQRESLGCSR